MDGEDKPIVAKAPQFISKLIGKKINIRLLSGGEPISGVLEAYNPYEIVLKTGRGDILVSKRSIAVIELADSRFR
jgi:hypothetical protein